MHRGRAGGAQQGARRGSQEERASQGYQVRKGGNAFQGKVTEGEGIKWFLFPRRRRTKAGVVGHRELWRADLRSDVVGALNLSPSISFQVKIKKNLAAFPSPP